MVIVTSGKIVIGLDVFSMGDEIAGLTAAEEKKLIALGLVTSANDIASAEADAEEQDKPNEKEPSKAELQARCRELGLSERGNKTELKARIDEFERAENEEPEAEIEADADDEPPTLSAEVPQ